MYNFFYKILEDVRSHKVLYSLVLIVILVILGVFLYYNNDNLNVQISVQSDIKSIQSEIKSLQDEIKSLQDEIESLQNDKEKISILEDLKAGELYEFKRNLVQVRWVVVRTIIAVIVGSTSIEIIRRSNLPRDLANIIIQILGG